MSTLSSLKQHIAPHLPGASDAALFHALWWMHQQFCGDTLAWQQTLQDQDVVLNQVEYELEPEFDDSDAQGEVGSIVFVRLYGTTPTANTRNNYRELVPPGDCWLNDAGNLELHDYPTATVTSGMSVRVSINPLDAVDYMDPVLYRQYRDAITSGALQYLMLQPQKKYSNATLGAYWKGEYESLKLRAMYDLKRGGNIQAEVYIQIPRL